MKRHRGILVAAVAAAASMPACSLLLADDYSDGPHAGNVPDEAAAPRSADGGADADDGASDVADASSVDVDATVVDEGLLGWWSFDEATGTSVADLTGHGHVAVLEGDALVTQTGAHAGAAVVLSNVDTSNVGRIVVPSLAGAAFPRTGTLSIWFRWDSMNTADHIGIFDLWADDRGHVYLRHPNGASVGYFQFALQHVGAGPYAVSINFDAPPKSWTHVVMVWDEAAAQARVHVNGSNVQGRPYASAFAPDDQRFVLGLGLAGAIDEVKLYSRALGADEASALP